MLKFVTRISVSGVVALWFTAFPGCSSISKVSCATTDWKSEGMSDGLKGQSEDKILKTQKSCSERGIEISVMEYKEGWLKGIEQYCSAKHAYSLGISKKKGKVENCPVEMRSKFVANYERAEKFLKTKKMIGKTEDEIQNLKSDVKELEAKKTNLVDRKTKIKEKAEKLSSKSVKYDIK